MGMFRGRRPDRCPVRQEKFPRRLGSAVLALLVALLGAVAAGAAGEAGADRYVAEAWQVAEGLPDNEVTAVAQAADGYLWVGTRGGLARFDGVRFEVFDGTTPGLEEREVRRLFADPQGGLWVSLASGRLVRYFGGRFSAFGARDGWSAERAASFAVSNTGDVLVADPVGTVHEFRSGRFTEAVPTAAPRGVRFQQWTLDRQGGEWAVTADRQLQRLQGMFWEPVRPGGAEPVSDVVRIAAARGGGLWVFERQAIRLLEGGRWTREFAGNPEQAVDAVTCALEDSMGNLWVGTAGAKLYRYGADRSPMVFSAPTGFPPGAINDLHEDRDRNVWVASSGGGLVRLRLAVFQSYGAAEGLPPQSVLAIAEEAPGRVMLGTREGGIVVLEHGRFFGPVSLLGKPISVGALQPGRSGGIWGGTDGEGLLKLDGAKSARWSVRDGLADAAVLSVFEDRAGELWLGTPAGLTRFAGGRFTHYTPADGLPDVAVRTIAQDLAGDLWLGTAAGVVRFRDGRFTVWRRRDGLPSDLVQSLLADRRGGLWIGTVDGGLSRFRDGQFVNFSTRNGLPDNSITAILDDGLGYLWLGTGRGVCRIAQAELESAAAGRPGPLDCVTYLVRDGLPSIQCAAGHPSAMVAADGRLWFATTHGISVVDPARIRRNPVPPPVVIEELSADGEVIFSNRRADGTDGRTVPATWTVPAGRRHLEIAFTALSFANPAQARFRIRLEGGQAEWRDVGNRRVAFFDGLAPGSYRFQVKAANRDGVWNEAGATVAFVVQPFYWETLWFRAGAGAGLVLLASLSVRGRIIRRERERVAETLRLQGVALGSAGDGIVITDHLGKIVWTNPAFTRQSGYAPADVLGRHIRLLNSGQHPREFFESMWTTLLAGRVWQAEIVNRNRDGTFSTYEQTTTPVPDPHGAIAHFVAINRDISHRKRMEKALGDSEERFRTLALATFEGIIIYDGCEILEVNRATADLFGYPPAELIGRSVLELVEAPSRERFEDHFRRHSEAPQEFTGRHRSGSQFDLEVRCRAYPFRGRMVRVAAVRDITESRQVQRRIQFLVQQKALEAERSRIARDMHDEMGSSLTRITLLCEAAEMGLASPDEADRAGARARLQRIAALGRSLVTSMDEIVWAVNPGNDSLEEFASYVCHFAPELLRSAGIQCRLEVPEVLPVRSMRSETRHHLFLVVKEALHNVVKHSGATTVALKLELPADELVITLADDGRGLGAGTGRRGGNGLANMRKRVAEMGGEIGWAGESGSGLRITIRVPMPAGPRP